MAAKTPLVLVPGHLCDAALWAHQTQHLADLAEIAVPDMRGPDSMAGLAELVLQAAPARFALAGLSMGGFTAFEIMRAAPGRVTRLALLDTAARPNTPPQIERRKRFMAMIRDRHFEDMLAEFTPLLVHPERVTDAALMDAIGRMARRVGADAALAQQQAMLDRPDSRPDCARIEVPTLVLCGRQDALTPLEAHEEMARDIPNAKLVAVEACGHMSPMEQPEAVTACLRYWLQL